MMHRNSIPIRFRIPSRRHIKALVCDPDRNDTATSGHPVCQPIAWRRTDRRRHQANALRMARL